MDRGAATWKISMKEIRTICDLNKDCSSLKGRNPFDDFKTTGTGTVVVTRFEYILTTQLNLTFTRFGWHRRRLDSPPHRVLHVSVGGKRCVIK